MSLYKPLNEPIPTENIEAVYKGEYEDGTPAEHPLTEDERGIIDGQMQMIERGLRETKIAASAEANGGQPGPLAGKLMFGQKSNLELLAMLGIWFSKLSKTDPEAWKAILKWSNDNTSESLLKYFRASPDVSPELLEALLKNFTPT